MKDEDRTDIESELGSDDEDRSDIESEPGSDVEPVSGYSISDSDYERTI